jgi:hypothetical protein
VARKRNAHESSPRSGVRENLRCRGDGQITTNNAVRLGADEVQIVRCGSYGWVRLTVAGTNSDPLFKTSGISLDRGFRPADEFAEVG